jgi:ABC-type polysaccharide/polyol phosphate export permease
MSSVLGAASLLKKVYIPKYVFPLEKCCFAMVNCVFSFVALALVMVFTGSPIHVTVFEALYPLVTLFFFSLGVGLFLAAATVFFRDIMHIWSVFITALLYFSAIFYDPTQMTFSIGGFNMQQIIKLNPMYWYITGFRRTVMWGISLDFNNSLTPARLSLNLLIAFHHNLFIPVQWYQFINALSRDAMIALEVPDNYA